MITIRSRMDNGIDCAPYQSVARVVPYSQMIFVDRPAPELGVQPRVRRALTIIRVAGDLFKV